MNTIGPVKITDGYGKKRYIGYLHTDTLHLERYKSKHFFRKYQAWAIDKAIIEQHPQILIFVLTDKESGIKYLATRRDFDIHARIIEFEGHLPQLALPIECWAPFK